MCAVKHIYVGNNNCDNNDFHNCDSCDCWSGSNNVHDYILSGLQIFLFSLFYVN